MLDNLLGTFRRVVTFLCVFLLSMQVLLVSYVAFGRYVLNRTPAWGENSALLCMVWFCMLSAALAVKDDSHLKVTFIEAFLPKKAIKIIDFINLLLIAGFGLALLVWGIPLVSLTHRNIMTGLGLPSSILYASVPVTGAAFLISAFDRGRDFFCPPK